MCVASQKNTEYGLNTELLTPKRTVFKLLHLRRYVGDLMFDDAHT